MSLHLSHNIKFSKSFRVTRCVGIGAGVLRFRLLAINNALASGEPPTRCLFKKIKLKIYVYRQGDGGCSCEL